MNHTSYLDGRVTMMADREGWRKSWPNQNTSKDTNPIPLSCPSGPQLLLWYLLRLVLNLSFAISICEMLGGTGVWFGARNPPETSLHQEAQWHKSFSLEREETVKKCFPLKYFRQFIEYQMIYRHNISNIYQ